MDTTLYDEQMEDLDSTIDTAIKRKGNKNTGFTKHVVLTTAILGIGGLAATAILGSYQKPDIPSHEERVAYFIDEYDDEWFRMEYSPDFSEANAWSTAREHLWVYITYPKEPGVRESKHIGVVDGLNKDDPADGTPDWTWASLPSGRIGSSCHIEYALLPEHLQDMLLKHYVAGSEGFYRHVTEGTESYEGNIGDDEFEEFFSTCKSLTEN